MRISATKTCQLIESDPPKLVLVDDITGHEILLSAREAYYLFRSIGYFSNDLGLITDDLVPADPVAPPAWPYGGHGPPPDPSQ